MVFESYTLESFLCPYHVPLPCSRLACLSLVASCTGPFVYLRSLMPPLHKVPTYTEQERVVSL